MIHFQKRKQQTPMKFLQEQRLFERTVDRHELSTSVSSHDKPIDETEKMVRKVTAKDVRQDTVEVRCRISYHIGWP